MSAGAAWRVEAADEGRHAAGPERLWNESWYFDFVTTDGTLGGFLRMGLNPNQDGTWCILVLTGPGRATVRIDDRAAPAPGAGALAVATDHYELALDVVEPLGTWRITGEGRGESFDDPAGILRGEPGTGLDVAVELTWTTDGEPYGYPVGARYEIPCLVDGTIRIGGETHQIEAGVGQRDHSWGVRDWEGAGWCWSACRLDDGTRAHLTEIRLPGGSFALGYVQDHEGLTPIEAAAVTETFDASGLASTGALLLQPSGLALAVAPLAHAPTTITTPAGTIRPFPRAMARFTAADGRHGLGWIEWNLLHDA